MASPLTPDQIEKYGSRLFGLGLWPGLTRRWQQNRAIQKLAQDGSSAAARALVLTVFCPRLDGVIWQNLITALKSILKDQQLEEIAGNAINSDWPDYVRERLLSLVKQADYLPFEPPDLRVSIALACEWPERLADDGPEVVPPLLKAYEIFSDRREVALSTIRALRAQGTIDTLCRHWMESGAAGDDLATLLLSAGHSPSKPAERALFWLLIGQTQRYEELDHDGTLLIQAQAIDRICRYWMKTGAAGDDLATLLLSAGHSPSEPAERALFWLLIGQIQRYEELDLDGLLLVQAHAAASANVRKRLAVAAAAAGRMEWLGAMQQCKSLDQFDANDWATTVQVLARAGDPQSIWQWALKASPMHAQELLLALPTSTSQPTGIPEAALGLKSFAKQLPLPDRHYLLPLTSGSFDNPIWVWANEVLSLLAMPLACYGEKQWNLLSTLQESKQLKDWQRPWLEFIAALGSVIRRFDVTVDDGDTQSTASPFEVEIDG